MNRHCPNYTMHYYKLYKCGFYDLDKLIEIYNDYEKIVINGKNFHLGSMGAFVAHKGN